jgi:SAM-dependent methyltransferase
MIWIGRNRFPHLVLAVCDAVNLHLTDDESVDFYHSNQVAEHWRPDHVPLIFAEAFRVMKEGGHIFVVMDTTELFERQDRKGESEDPTNRCIQPLQWWRDRLADAGFSPDPETEAKMRNHPNSYFSKYDWDGLLYRKSVVELTTEKIPE